MPLHSSFAKVAMKDGLGDERNNLTEQKEKKKPSHIFIKLAIFSLEKWSYSLLLCTVTFYSFISITG